jgi:hypothetical protein
MTGTGHVQIVTDPGAASGAQPIGPVCVRFARIR